MEQACPWPRSAASTADRPPRSSRAGAGFLGAVRGDAVGPPRSARVAPDAVWRRGFAWPPTGSPAFRSVPRFRPMRFSSRSGLIASGDSRAPSSSGSLGGRSVPRTNSSSAASNAQSCLTACLMSLRLGQVRAARAAVRAAACSSTAGLRPQRPFCPGLLVRLRVLAGAFGWCQIQRAARVGSRGCCLRVGIVGVQLPAASACSLAAARVAACAVAGLLDGRHQLCVLRRCRWAAAARRSRGTAPAGCPVRASVRRRRRACLLAAADRSPRAPGRPRIGRSARGDGSSPLRFVPRWICRAGRRT